MEKQVDIETQRLLLRRWEETDLDPFIRMNADPEVMRYFPKVSNAEETRAFYDRIQQEFSSYGYGLYAAEEKNTGRFMGFIGFHWAAFDVDFCPCIEMGWRLDREFWGKGYATEGAKACFDHGLKHLGFDQVYSFTAVRNVASQKVMQKTGLQFERYFDHPNIPEGHPLKPHICYCKANADSLN